MAPLRTTAWETKEEAFHRIFSNIVVKLCSLIMTVWRKERIERFRIAFVSNGKREIRVVY